MITKNVKNSSTKLRNISDAAQHQTQKGHKPKCSKALRRGKLKTHHEGSDNQVSTNCVQPHAAFTPSQQLVAMGAHNLSQITLPRPRKHWGSYIVSRRIGMIVAPRGTGKSTFILGLGLSMAYEAEFLGHKPARQRRVLILDGEMDLHTMRERLKEQTQALNVESDDIHLRFISPELFDGLMPNLSTADGQRQINEVLGDKWDVLIIDNYSAFSESGREDAESWMPWIRWMLGHKRTGKTIIVVHHTGKNGQQRGSSKHEDALDFSIALQPVPNDNLDGSLRFTVEWRKSRHLPSDKTRPFLVTYAKTAEGYEWVRGNVEDADAKKVEAKKLLKEGMKPIEIATKVGVHKGTISKWMKVWKEEIK